MSSVRIMRMTLNGQDMSEFYLHALAAAYYKVTSVFVSGDAGLCDEVKGYEPNIETVATIEGVGDSVVTQHPKKSLEEIHHGVKKALSQDFSGWLLKIPESLHFSITFKKHIDAYRASFYPGAELLEPHVVGFKTDDFFEVMRFNLFAY